jgi:hypothetical protein
MVARMIPFTGKPTLIAHGAIRVPHFTNNGIFIQENKKFDCAKSVSDLLANAIWVLSKEGIFIELYGLMVKWL